MSTTSTNGTETNHALDPQRSRDSGLLEAVLTSAGIGCLAGAIAGFLWGGIGGRIAMRVVFLTSNDSARGLTSDDGFEIGKISGAMVFLLIFTTVLGAIAGFVYGLLRMVTAGPTWAVAAGMTVTTATAGGASIVHTDGIAFRFLDPVWLTIGLFVLIPGMWALTVVLLAERLLKPGALTPFLPHLVHRRYWGATGWLVLAAFTTLGTLDLASDITALA